LNVLYIQNSYPAASFLMTELHELDRRGHDVAVFANNEQEDIVHEAATTLDIPVGHVSSLDVSGALQSIPGFIRRLASGGVEFPFDVLRTHRAEECVEFVRSLDYEVEHIHVHFPVKGNIHAIDVAEELDVSLTVTAHAFEIFSDGLTETTREMCDSASRVLTISEYNRTYLKDVVDISNPVDVVPASVRLEKFTSDEDRTVPNRVLTVGRLVPKKGHIYAVDAISILSEEYPNIEYHIVGGGDGESEIRRRVERQGIDSNVRFLGKVSDSRLRREFSEAAAFVLPCVIDGTGNRDGIPVVLMEAMAMRTPCISTYVSGIPELITDDETGLLVPERDGDALADAIKSLLEDPGRRESLRASARSYLESNHRISVEADKLIRSFELASGAV
jgi:glycosyltransferase involved in cell wall biosynthesis